MGPDRSIGRGRDPCSQGCSTGRASSSSSCCWSSSSGPSGCPTRRGASADRCGSSSRRSSR
jgi:hypothetical protein